MSCAGNCCAAISIPIHPKELELCYAAWRKGEKTYQDEDGKERAILRDIHLLYPMLVFRGYSKTHGASGKPMDWVDVEKEPDVDCHAVYYCKHYDLKNKLCTIYEHRPDMCITYPDSGPCKIEGCTIQAGGKVRDY